MARPRKDRVVKQTKVFSIGDKSQGADFSKEEIEALIYKIAMWFASPDCDRKTEDPVEEARARVMECVLAETKEGKPWIDASDNFATRIKIKCHYDLNEDHGLEGLRTVKNPRGGRDFPPGSREAAKDMKNTDIVASQFDAETFRTKVEKDIFEAYPELDNPAHAPNVRRLSLLYAQQEVVDRKLAANPGKDSTRETLLKQLKEIEQMSQTTMKVLGIHPDQLRKDIANKVSGSLSEVVKVLEEDNEFPEREKAWSLQLALQLWWMTQHPNGRGDGPQLYEWEMWHYTRTRPIKFVCECGRRHHLVEGFKPDELRDYLIAQSVLVEVPVLKGLIPAAALQGLGSQHWRITEDGEFIEEIEDGSEEEAEV